MVVIIYNLDLFNLHEFPQVTVQKCDVGYDVSNHGAMKLVTSG